MSAEPAAVLAAFGDLGLLNTFDAALAALFDVCSFLDMLDSVSRKDKPTDSIALAALREPMGVKFDIN